MKTYHIIIKITTKQQNWIITNKLKNEMYTTASLFGYLLLRDSTDTNVFSLIHFLFCGIGTASWTLIRPYFSTTIALVLPYEKIPH